MLQLTLSQSQLLNKLGLDKNDPNLKNKLQDILDKQNTEPEPLPNLEFKFVCANSLIGLNKSLVFRGDSGATSAVATPLIGPAEKVSQDVFTDHEKLDESLMQLQIIRSQNFKSGASKTTLSERWQQVVEEAYNLNLEKIKNKDQDGLEIAKLTNWNPFNNESATFFDPEWMFGIPEFDLVIGNPPYVQLQKDGGKLGKQFEKLGFETFAKTGDIYQLFYELGYNLLKTNGILSFITSNKWMRAGYGKTTRQFLAAKTNPLILLDLGENVFESATVDSNILVCQKK